MESLSAFKTNYVLIDYENIQPKNLALLTKDYFRIYLFLGAKQNRLSLDLVDTMHQFGPARSKYIYVTQSRANALDFYLTYYLGMLTTKDSKAYFHVISKDKGFDPLIEHLNTIKVNANRRESIADIPVLDVTSNAKIEDKISAIVKNLTGRGSSKPRKETTLKNTIKNTFQQKLTEAEVNAVFNKLKKSNYIKSNSGNISYHLPK